ncbi:MAG: hypothetical protein E6Q41_01520 [Cyclobacteriaceae bacterium]|nr:MAG: hypothetical protein E6Q41_01520 [Cyclobacteriaceae bacterium]
MTLETRRATGNTRFASCGVTCLHSCSVFQLGFSSRLTVLFSENPHERKAWERWWQGGRQRVGFKKNGR